MGPPDHGTKGPENYATTGALEDGSYKNRKTDSISPAAYHREANTNNDHPEMVGLLDQYASPIAARLVRIATTLPTFSAYFSTD